MSDQEEQEPTQKWFSCNNLTSCGQSKARFVNDPNEEDWEHLGETYENGLPVKQCGAAETSYTCAVCDTKYPVAFQICPECRSPEKRTTRCKNIAVSGKSTCTKHSGGIKRTQENTDLSKRASIKHGMSVSQIMLCPCRHAANCEYVNALVDVERYGSSVPRCLPEQVFYDSTIEHLRETYEFDDAADQIMLNRLVMAIVRTMRGERLIAEYGELVERTRQGSDGSFESWFEQNPITKTVDSLDKNIRAWFKELNISKAAREGKTININKKVSLTKELSSKISEDEIIEIEFDE